MAFISILKSSRRSQNYCGALPTKHKQLAHFIENNEVVQISKPNPSNYWKDLGFSTIVYPTTVRQLSTLHDYQVVMARNKQFTLDESDDSSSPKKPWCIDGLCATGKTSSLRNLVKTNNNICSVGQNLHVSSSLGYFFTSLEMMYGKPNEIYDRTPYNNIYPWFQIWMALAKEYVDRRENKWLAPTVGQLHGLLTQAIHPKTLQFLTSTVKCILLVDSNERLAIKRLQNRNSGSDYERSSWKSYIRLQNLFYYHMAITYPENFILIDLNMFDCNLSRVQAIIQMILSKHGNAEIAENPKPMKTDTTSNIETFCPLSTKNGKQILSNYRVESERIRPLSSQYITNISSNLHSDMFKK